jgi:hypothetical protein
MHKAPSAMWKPLPPRDAAADEDALASILAEGDCSAYFCSTCRTLHTKSASAAHTLASHDLVFIRNIFAPSRSLPNLGIDEQSAQCVPLCPKHFSCRDILRMYFFSLDSLDHLLRIIKHYGASAVVCIGCPSVHEALVDSGSDSV